MTKIILLCFLRHCVVVHLVFLAGTMNLHFAQVENAGIELAALLVIELDYLTNFKALYTKY